MEAEDEVFINAPRDQVYTALNDPEGLKDGNPGCDDLTKHSDTELTA